MKERPIIFSGPMVLEILNGRKTQTRRIVKFREPYSHHYSWPYLCRTIDGGWAWQDIPCNPGDVLNVSGRKCPHGMPGDRLWVRESFCTKNWTDDECAKLGCPDAKIHPSETYLGIATRAIYRNGYNLESRLFWKSPIHMPRWASRITLEITGIRVEKLQDISYNDVIAEGFHEWLTDEQQTDSAHMAQAKLSFGVAWDHLNRKRASWQSNPYVWVIEFVRMDKGAACVARQTLTTA